MIETRVKVYNSVILLTDLASAVIPFLAAVVYSSSLPFLTGSDGLTYVNLRSFAGLSVALAAMLGAHAVFSSFGYSMGTAYRVQHWLRLSWHLALLAGLDCCLMLSIYWAFMSTPPSREFLMSLTVLVLFCSLFLRLLVRTLLGWHYRSKSNMMNILVVGTNLRARDFSRYILANPFLGYRLVGFMDDLNYLGDESMQIVAPLREFTRVARENVLDAVAVFLPVRSYYDQIMSIIESSRIQGVPVQHMHSFFDHSGGQAASDLTEAYPVMRAGGMRHVSIWLLVGKRLFDLVFSCLALVVTFPVLLMSMAAIKLDSPGPVFFIQRRVGYHKRKFGVIKLRTMVRDAEQLMPMLDDLNEMDGPVFKIRKDPRTTRVGRVLRRYHIDELPQFINVLLGEMSVVGPRPMAERDFAGFSEDWLNKRFSVRPGLTCTWQIQPNRNRVSFNIWMTMDMEYIDNWNLWRDIQIVLLTVVATLKGSGI